MKSLGKSFTIIKTGAILIRSKTIPKLYSSVATEDRKVVGKINDIIGPIMDPYIVVKPSPSVLKNPNLIEGRELYEMPKAGKKRDKKWTKRR